MISFYPGPSKLYPEVRQYLQEAYDTGILSVNHRSSEFVEISKQAVTGLKQKLSIPEDYKVYFVSSATEAWEIIAQSLVREKSYHLYNGAFGEKWYEYTGKLKRASGVFFGPENAITAQEIVADSDSEIICVTHNETSNGTALPAGLIRGLKAKYPGKLIAVDATSSMAGVNLDISSADIWFASVQKCFGLPAGMALMICSPEVGVRAGKIGERGHYNSYLFMEEKMNDWQTTYTPNVLTIFLLSRLVSHIADIADTHRKINARSEWIYSELGKSEAFSPLVKTESLRSETVAAFSAEEGRITEIKKAARQAGFLLGNGYGAWKNTTFRIANFPAITDEELEQLINFLKKI